MIRGHIDGITVNGFVEGWAFDDTDTLRALDVVLEGPRKRVLAFGKAGLYREDLAEAALGYGWCSFRLRLLADSKSIVRRQIALVAKESREKICSTANVAVLTGEIESSGTITDCIAQDPTTLQNISQLRACDSLFRRMIQKVGLSAFVRHAYLYVLGRSADEQGVALYTQLIADGKMSPFSLLDELYRSDEFKASMRVLASPHSPGFVFGS
jgi:hypothetical protein